MKSKTNRIHMLLIATLVLCLAAALALAAPVQGPPGQRGPAQPLDPLRQLNVALQNAGASALTDDQAKQITSLIQDFRTSTRPAPPTTAIQQARANYENAIINGDLATATAQIPILAGEQTGNAPARMQAEAKLAICIVQVLQSSGQLAILQKSMNNSQLVRLLQSLAGGGGPGQGPGRGGQNPTKK